MKYFYFELPTEDEMDTMTMEELIEWRDRLAPYYADRFNYGFPERLKCFKYSWFRQMVENINNGVDRWERVATRTS